MRLKLVLLSFILAVFAGCSSDDNSSNGTLAINEQNLSGKWYIKGGTFNGGEFENYNHDCAENKDFQEFFMNHSVTFNGYDVSCNMTDTGVSVWSLEGNVLTIENEPFDPMVYQYSYTVMSITSEELVLKAEYEGEEGAVTEISYFTRS